MFSKDALEKILFLDIETVSESRDYGSLSHRMQALWDKKSRKYQQGDTHDPAQVYKEKAGIHAEFAKVACISCGYLKFTRGTGEAHLRVKSFYDLEEKVVLEDFGKMLNNWAFDNLGKRYPDRTICAHNGKEFDFPFLGRRYLIKQISLPDMLNLQGKKPWETNLVDTMELWKFGDFKAYTSLDLLSAVLDVPSPKDDIDGSQVGRVFWEDNDLERIKNYCEKDVLTTAQVLLRMCRLPLAELIVV